MLMKNSREVIPAALVIFLFMGMTMQRGMLWQTPLSIWTDSAVKSPQKSRVHNNVGMSYLLMQKRFAAIAAFQRAIDLDQYLPAHFNLAVQLDTLGFHMQSLHSYKIFCTYAPPSIAEQKKACVRLQELIREEARAGAEDTGP